MLRELRIENLLLIERAELRLGDGLNVITGETGAGKTILAHSIDLLSGGKARDGIVRPGAREAYVEGVFELPDGLLAEPEMAVIAERIPDGADEIVLARRVFASGRTSAFVGGRSASALDLRLLSSRLLAFYGQHEHRKLTLASAQMEILDGFAGAAQLRLRDRFRDSHSSVVGAGRELEELLGREGARERDLDLMRYEIEEITAAELDPDEEHALEAKRDRLRNVEVLREAAGSGLVAIDSEDGESGARALLAAADSSLSGTATGDRELASLSQRISALSLEVGEVGRDLRFYLEGLEADPARLQEVEERLDLLERLKRKHGGSVESVLAHAELCRGEVERLETASERGLELQARLEQFTAERDRLGVELSAARERAAGALEAAVGEELARLAMDGARLEVSLAPHPDGVGPAGREQVELRVATNPGMPLAPLRDAASGGELSRVMLALSSLAVAGGPGTVVFDEIDAGIGGTTANAVGERLRALGSSRQVICITHLPQVASMATVNFRIVKRAEGGTASTAVERVQGEELVSEICRMMGAESDDEVASSHARELLAAA